MFLSYKTERLPLNFLMLGFSLALIGIATTINGDYEGSLTLLLAIPLLFIQSGIVIDHENKRLRKYTGLFFLRFGKWIDVTAAQHLQIIRVRETKGMAVLSIGRNETNIVQKLILVMPRNQIVMFSGKQTKVEKIAKEIADNLKLELKYPKN